MVRCLRRAFTSVDPVVVPNVRSGSGNQVAQADDRKERAMKRYFGVAVVAGILAGSMQMNADEAISITVRPAVTSYRGNAQLKVLVSPNDRNRLLVWEVDGPSFYRSSSIALDGAASPRSYFFMVKDLPGGEFEVRATVKRNDSSAATDRSTIKVVGGPG
jgi:hypothetical protein